MAAATGTFTFFPLDYETNGVMEESRFFRVSEKIRIQIVFNKKMQTNTLIKFYFEGFQETIYTMNDITTSEDIENSVYSYDLTLPQLNFHNNENTSEDSFVISCVFTQDNSLNENKDIDNTLIDAHQNNNDFTLYNLIPDYNFVDDVIIDGEIGNNNYKYSTNGLVYLRQTSYNRKALREVFQYKLYTENDYIDATYQVETGQYKLNLPNDIYTISSISFRYKTNIGVKIDNTNANVIVVDNTKPYVSFIYVSDLDKQTKKLILLKGKNYSIRIKFSKQIPINQNIFQNIYFHKSSTNVNQDELFNNYVSIQSEGFVDINSPNNDSNYSISQKYTATFTPNVNLNMNDLSLYIKNNSYEDSFANPNYELSSKKYSNTFDINTETPSDPVVYFPVNQDLRTNLFYGRIEPLDSSAVAWEYEYKTVNGDIQNKLRMNITSLTFQLPEGIYLPGDVVVRTYNNYGNPSNDVKNTRFIDIDRTAPLITLNGTSLHEFHVFENINTYNEEFISISPDIIENITRDETYTLQITIYFNGNNEIMLINEVLSLDTENINRYKNAVNASVSYNTVGIYTIEYSVSDDVGNVTTITRQINIIDDVAPILRIKGPNPQYLSTKEYYEEYGAYAYDNYDGDISAVVTVNYSELENSAKIPGEYTIYYNVKDSSNNQAQQVSRKIIVYEPSCGCAPKTPNFKQPQNSSYNNSNISSKLFLAQRIRNNGKMNSNSKSKSKLKMYKTLYSRDEDSIKNLLFSIGEERMRQLVCLMMKSNLSEKIKYEIESVSNNIFDNLDESEQIKLENICN